MRLKLVAVLGLTIACLVWVLWGLDLHEVWVALSRARWVWMLPMLVIYLAGHAMRSYRLGLLLEHDVPFVGLLSVTSVGYLAINVVPLRLGEFVRPYLLLQKHEVPFGSSLAAILVERLLDMSMLLGMLLLAGWVVDLPETGVVVPSLGIDVVSAGQRFTGAISLMGLAGIVALLAAGRQVLALMERLPGARVLVPLATTFHGGLRSLLARPAQGLAALGVSLVIWTTTVIAVTCVLQAFEGLPHSLGAGLTTWSVTLAGITVAPTPGFVGAYEAFCKASLLLWDVGADLAVTFSVVLHMGQFGFTVAAGGLFIFIEGLSLRRLVAESRETARRGGTS